MSLLQWFLLGTVIMCGVSGQTLLKFTMNIQANSTHESVYRLITTLLFTPLLWLSLVCYGTASVIYLYLLSNIEVSRLYPTTVALMMIFVTASGIVIVGETFIVVSGFSFGYRFGS